MIWTILMSCLVTSALGNKTGGGERLPFFHGHVFENAAPGSRVSGLSIPVTRLLDARRWCADSGTRLTLLGDGSGDFRVFAHHKRGQMLLKTSGTLDREERSGYLLRVGLCCASAGPAVAEVACVKVDVLDTNDHQPKFPNRDIKINLDDATALRSVVYKVTAEDADSGKNAELIYFALPKNGTFYVVPKTGDVLLVDSILGLSSPIKLCVFARDHGWPPRTSQGVEMEISPRQWPAVPRASRGDQDPIRARMSRSLLDPDEPLVINVSEDAGIGSVVINLNPARFPSAGFELTGPDVESSPVTVNRDSGDVVITRRLDRETDPLVEITVKVQDKRDERFTRSAVLLRTLVVRII
ncbi:hypothetical protein DPEC_G00344540 [Dallia pectoralis]|uniref:Uncharacterized protein n=1 Tax=Dallia pectoralis TaxID=75939 RepID=A0ACC2F399_DALPE|nr:hypothetical protein DPEC_G00344540 [Dallia pectoralis]